VKTIPLSEVAGTELVDVDVSRELSDADVRIARAAYDESHVVVVRGQRLTRDQFARFAGYFWPLAVRENGLPRFTAVSNRDQANVVGDGVLLFHSDESFRSTRCPGLALYANEVGGADVAPTSFAHTIRAFRALSPDLRTRIQSLRARNMLDVRCTDGEATYRVRQRDLPPDADPDRYPYADHPVLVPVGSRRELALFISHSQTSHILDIDDDSSERILQEVFSALYASDNVLVHRWSTGDVVVWNNIALQHGRPEKVGSGTRDLWRLKAECALATQPCWSD
jgi:taurine dioxygenase